MKSEVILSIAFIGSLQAELLWPGQASAPGAVLNTPPSLWSSAGRKRGVWGGGLRSQRRRASQTGIIIIVTIKIKTIVIVIVIIVQ